MSALPCALWLVVTQLLTGNVLCSGEGDGGSEGQMGMKCSKSDKHKTSPEQPPAPLGR